MEFISGKSKRIYVYHLRAGKIILLASSNKYGKQFY